jgi:anti-anti-sigma factor
MTARKAVSTFEEYARSLKDSFMVPPPSALFDVEIVGNVLVITPRENLGEFGITHFEQEAPILLQFWNEAGAIHAIVDFHRTDYFGSTMLGLLVKLGRYAAGLGGRLVMCGVSNHEAEVIAVAGLQHQWPTCATRDEALALVQPVR